MNWTPGTWADVAIGDDVLGADGYPWRVTDAEKRYAPNGDEYRAVEMERDGRTPARASIPADKPVKYRKAEPATETCPGCSNPLPAGHKFPYCSPCIDEAEGEGTSRCGVSAMRHFGDADPSDPWPTTAVIVESKPYVEYDDAERAAAAALKGAGLQMTVIERQMTLDGLTQHIGAVHGEPLPGAGGNLTRIELRSRLADLHFQLHERDQARGQRWEPRGSTAHVHPVMDRPMEDAEPKSLRGKR